MNSTRMTMGCIIALSVVVAGLANARPAFARHVASGPTETAQVVADDTKAGCGATGGRLASAVRLPYENQLCHPLPEPRIRTPRRGNGSSPDDGRVRQ